jgi:hypothetical protein
MSVRALATQIVQICISFARLSRTGSAALKGGSAPGYQGSQHRLQPAGT